MTVARSLWLLTPLLFTLDACESVGPVLDREVFDEQTGNTLTVVSKPLVFARQRTDVAAYARDYATVVAVEVDHSGSYQDYLLVYRWSTVDKRMLPPENSDDGALRLIGEGRALSLHPLSSLPVGLNSTRNLHRPSRSAVLTRAYAVDADTMRFIAVSGTLTLQLPHETFDAPFVIWEDGRRALAQFLQQTGLP